MAFPPDSYSTVTKTIPSYLYVQYANDDDLQAFVAAYNGLAQQYVTWFASIGLPVYTGLSGDLLDWVGAGLYGLARPSLSSGVSASTGPFDTLTLDSEVFNYSDVATAPPFVATSDDSYKRMLTWAFFKDDGKTFNVRWLKRRVVRFITSADGGNADTSNTYDVSVVIAGTTATITISGALVTPLATILQKGIASGALELPFQYDWVVVV